MVKDVLDLIQFRRSNRLLCCSVKFHMGMEHGGLTKYTRGLNLGCMLGLGTLSRRESKREARHATSGLMCGEAGL